MKPKLLFISLEHWDEIWRRNQFLAQLMQKDFVVTFVGPPLPFWQILRKKIRSFENIRIRYIYKFFPERLWPGANRWLYQKQVPAHADILWLNDQSKYFLLNAPHPPRLIYDITDDWTLLYPSTKTEDAIVCQKASAIIVCSQNLFKTREKYKAKLFLIPNGVNIQDYKLKQTNKRGDYFLYTGSLHEERLDIDLMATLARKFPAEEFWYVGPIFFGGQARQQLAQYPNIKLLGAKPYQELSKYMVRAKALIVPHLVSAFVNSLDPIKQYEYMLSDRPVIATAVSGFKDWPQLFCLAKDKQEFLALIQKVIDRKIKVDLGSRLRAGRENSWQSRYNMVRGILCSEKYSG